VYEEVSPLKRAKLHNVVGCALEKVYAKKLDEHFGELALHFLEGGDKDKALDYFLKAGEKAQKVYAYLEAFSYLQHALELLEEKGDNLEERAGIIERLGDLEVWIGEIEAGMAYLDKSLTLWIQLGDRKSISRLHVKTAQTLWNVVGDKEKASAHHRMALEILEKEPESIELARLYEDISHMLWRTGEPAKALCLTKKAFELAEKLGDSEILSECYNDLGQMSRNAGEIEQSIRYQEDGLKIALESSHVKPAILLYINLGYTYETIGDLQRAFETEQKGFELAKKVGEMSHYVWASYFLEYFHSLMGEVQKALSMAEESLALCKRTRNIIGIAQHTCAIGHGYRMLGEWDKSLKYLREARDLLEKVGEYQFSGVVARLLGELFMDMEDYAEAEKYLNESNSIFEKALDKDKQFRLTLPVLARLYLKKGEIEKAKELIEKIHEYETKTKNRLYLLDVELLKAMLFREQKNWERSIQHFEKSLQEAKSLNLQKWYVYQFAELLYEYGLMYLERNQDGDKDKACSLLNRALEIYQKMGARKDVEKVEAKIAFVETGKAVSKPKPVSHVSTGYADLDRLLYGGIPSNCAVVLTSPSCNERDWLIKSFLETGAKKGEAAFYVTINPGAAKTLADEFQSSFCLFVCNPQADAIVKSAPNVIKLKGVENLTDISIALTSAIRKLDESLKGARRICIGLVSDVLLQHHAVQTRRWLAALIPELQSEGFTMLAVIDPQMHPSEELHAVLGLFDGEIKIHERETEEGSQKFLKIKKMSNQKYLDNELLLRREDPQK